MTGKTLVAGVGNIFQRDDAFGVEVVRQLEGRPWPPGVKVADFGIRGVHLVYELLDGCDVFVLVDAAQRGCAPGTVTVLEVFAMLASMGGRPGRTLVVACEPADVSPGMGLSDQVREALPAAVRAVEEILDEIQREEGADDHVQSH
jgi:hydrogenase maturation protease